MPCEGAFASVEDFVSFQCQQSRISRVHTGAPGAAVLTDSMAKFRTLGVESDTGMILYNLSDASSGVVTAVSETELTAPLSGGVLNNWQPGDQYLIVTVGAFERASIESFLAMTASDVHASLAAQGMCNCTLSGWGAELVKKLNIIDAMSFHTCGCRTALSDTERQQYRNWVSDQLTLIRTGKLDLCGGALGADAPAFGSAAQAVTEFAAAQIVADRISRGR
jgi:hypothetical protein